MSKGTYFSKKHIDEGDRQISDQLRSLREKDIVIHKIAERYGAHNLRVFGSVARGDDTSKSDVDFLVDMEPNRSLMDLGGLLMELQRYLESEVDVVTEDGLRERVRQSILEEAVPL
jgi:predicted nucleotidyltransferase